MRHMDWRIIVVLSLVFVVAVLYVIFYAVRGDASDVLVNLATDITLIPVGVFVMKLLIDGVLTEKEKHSRSRKVNMVAGAFFSEVGTALIERLYRFDPTAERLREAVVLKTELSDRDFSMLGRRLKAHAFEIESRSGDLGDMKTFLTQRRDFMLRLLENPNVLEQETFSNLLWAVFHLYEELANRKDLSDLSAADYEHLSGDMRRCYSLLIEEWVIYLEHLRHHYPYLFSLAVRMNPFNPHAAAEIV